MISLFVYFSLMGACDFSSAYQKALEDDASGSYGMNMDRYCPGASRQEREEFKAHYDRVRSRAEKIRDMNLDKSPSSAKDLEMMLKNRELIDKKVTAQTDEGAANKKKEILAERIKMLEAENMRLREELQSLKAKQKD